MTARAQATIQKGVMPFCTTLDVSTLANGEVRIELIEHRGSRRCRRMSYGFTPELILRALQTLDSGRGQAFVSTGPTRLSLLDHSVPGGTRGLGELLTMVLMSTVREASTGSGRTVTRRFGRSFATAEVHEALRRAATPEIIA